MSTDLKRCGYGVRYLGPASFAFLSCQERSRQVENHDSTSNSR